MATGSTLVGLNIKHKVKIITT